PDEEDCGDRIVKHLLSGNRGHYGPLEHPQIVFNCGWFPHSVMQQLRTHRVGISMDVQSGRYTGQRIIEVAEGRRDVEEVFYLRPIGTYSDRQSKRYEYGSDHREWHKTKCIRAAQDYHIDIKSGLSEEHARDLIPFGIRQHWVLSLNLRSLMHILLIRGKRDAQLECQQLCELMLPHFQAWCPQVYEWFEKNLWLKGRLAP
ncbi:MAG TPA: FAD-dependent thymidylate synthase, partial [Coleofasciculaceae cyanobacterium]